MRFDLRYGDGSLPLELSGRLTVDTLLPRAVEDRIDIKRTIVEAL
ncbi:MAG: hypothetical protein ACTSWA_03930 [Candidatus Thorarchaeota archaeon]